MTIPDSVTSIGIGAFQECKSLTDVYYTGSEEQWKKIGIDSSNTYLTNATIHYNYKPGISFNKETGIITLNSTEEISGVTLIVATYQNVKLIEAKSETVDIQVGENTFDSLITDYKDSDTVKIMVWNSLVGMCPLFEECSADL